MASKREDFRIFETSSNYELTPILLLQYISFFIRDEEVRATRHSWVRWNVFVKSGFKDICLHGFIGLRQSHLIAILGSMSRRVGFV